MRCPNCTAEMAEHRRHQIDLDRCKRCKGIWFDTGELVSYLSADRPEEDFGKLFAEEFVEGTLDYDERCPRCEEQTLVFGRVKRHGFSFCPTCFGMFFFESQLPYLGDRQDPADKAVAFLRSLIESILPNRDRAHQF